MKIAAIVVVYNPRIEDLIQNIRSYISDVDQLVIWKNSPIVINELINHDNIILLGDGQNVGIADALNGGAKWAIENSFTHILALDQDSYFKPGMLKKYKDLIVGIQEKDIGIYGINPNTWGDLLYKDTDGYLEVADTITSGSVFPVNIFKKFGFFDSDLFIDAVDYEFCYRLKSNNVRTIIFPEIILEHQVGAAVKTWLGFKTDNYSSFRTYFLIRNQIIIWKKYPQFFSSEYKITLIKSHIIFRIIKILLAERNKIDKMLAIIKGINHGIKGNVRAHIETILPYGHSN